MVGAAAGGLGGAALRTTMVVGARLGAIRQFGALSGSLNVVNNRFLQTGLGAANLVGTLSLLGGITNVLGNPITGLMGVLGAAAAAIDWLGQEEAIRGAKNQMKLWGDFWTDDEITQVIDNMNHVFGRDRTAEILSNKKAVSEFGKLWEKDEPLARNVLERTEEIRTLFNVPSNQLGALLLEVTGAAQNSAPAVQRLSERIGLPQSEEGLVPKLYEWHDIQERINKLYDEDGPANVSITKEMTIEADRLQDRWGHVAAEIINVLNIIPLSVFRLLNQVTDVIFAAFGFLYYGIIGMLQLAAGVFTLLGALMFAAVTGQWAALGPWLKDVWYPTFMLPAMINISEALLGVLDIFVPDFLVEWLGLMDWWQMETTDRATVLVDYITHVFSRLFTWEGFKGMGSFIFDALFGPIRDFLGVLASVPGMPDWVGAAGKFNTESGGSLSPITWSFGDFQRENTITIYMQIGDEILTKTISKNMLSMWQEQGAWTVSQSGVSGTVS